MKALKIIIGAVIGLIINSGLILCLCTLHQSDEPKRKSEL